MSSDSLAGQVRFSPGGNVLAARSDDGVLNLWRAPSWSEIEAAEARERGGLAR